MQSRIASLSRILTILPPGPVAEPRAGISG
jgi:hypothetical protein